MAANVVVRTLRQDELTEADRIMRTAFGTFLGLPDPMAFMGDADYVHSRWAADPSAALAAELDGRLVGTNFVTRWGSVGFFGPLTIEPGLWDKGIARRMLDETMAIFDRWGVAHAGLFTFGHSPKHVALYESYGFLPRFLTSVLSLEVAPGISAAVAPASAEEIVAECAELTGSIYPGFDVEREIRAAETHKLGGTVLVRDDDGRLAAFGVCHTGAGSEAGSGAVFVKVGAARPGPGAEQRFERLLDVCAEFAAEQGAGTLIVGVNTSRRGACRILGARGFRSQLLGVAMHRPDEGAYHHPDAWVLDDWR
jgi:GNAT superfamily N-acetyltransferase